MTVGVVCTTVMFSRLIHPMVSKQVAFCWQAQPRAAGQRQEDVSQQNIEREADQL